MSSQKRYPMSRTSHRGIMNLLSAPMKHLQLTQGNHMMIRVHLGELTFREYTYFGNLIVVECVGNKTFMVNPKWERYSRSTARALGAYRLWFAQSGYTEVEWYEI